MADIQYWSWQATIVLAVLLLAALLPRTPSAVAQEADIDPFLAEQLAAPSPPDALMVMVHARDGAHLDDATDAVLAGGLRPVTTWDRIGVAVAWGTPEQILALVDAPGVVYLEGNRPLTYELDTSHVATRADVAMQTFTDAEGNPLDGRGTSIAIIDSGIDGTHPMFQWPDGSGSKVARNLEQVCPLDPAEPYPDTTFNTLCLQDEPSNNTDTNSAGGHGTHVAGIAAGVEQETVDGRTVRGAAPGATLIGISAGGGIAVIGANNGLNWVLEHHEDPCAGNLPTAPQTCPPIRATNHSYGAIGGGDFDENAATVKLQRLLVAEGIVVNWAAGNDGGDGSADMTNPPAKDPVGGILNVANYSDGDAGTRDGALNSSSSRGLQGDVSTYPDISAPGTAITSACFPQLPICSTGLDTRDPFYNTITGTSMAAPHMAGYVTLLMQADPTLTPAQIEDLVEDTAHKFEAGGDYEADLADRNDDDTTSFDKGHGLVDMAAALGQVLDQDVPEVEESCLPDAPQVTDPQGDATAILLDTLVVNQPALDVLEAYLTSGLTGDDTVTFTIRVDDLPETPGGPTGNGEYFDFNFDFGGKGYYITASRTLTDGEDFVLGDFGGTGGSRRSLAPLTGSFDPETDLITAELPPQAIAEAVEGAPVVAEGAVFAGMQVVSRYELFILVPNADTATGACPFVLGTSTYAGGGEGTAEQPTVRVGDVVGPEGDSGTSDLTFEVSLSQTSDEQVTVDYATADGTAAAGEDYTATSGTVTFAPGETRKDVDVAVRGDTEEEDDETFTLQLSDAEGATIGDGTGTGTITDDDGPPSASAPDTGVEEGDSGTTTMSVPITLSEPAETPVTVDYATADGTATAGEDYTATSGTATFPPGTQVRRVDVSVIGDVEPEDDETVLLRLSDPNGATIDDGEATGTILDDDQLPDVSISDVTAPEGDEGSTPFTFTVALSEASEVLVSVDHTTADGNATAGEDYEAASGTVTFEPGTTEAELIVDVIGDRLGEGDEQLQVVLADAAGATITDGAGTGLILDDDQPVIDVDGVRTVEGEEATFTITLSAASDRTVVAQYATAAGTATREVDYQPASGQVVFEPGQTSRAVAVTTLTDDVVEEHETLELRLSSPSNAALGVAVGTATIIDGTAVTRLSGDERIATAVAISAASYADGDAAAVVLARADDFADALAGTPLAVDRDGPMLLTAPDALHAATEAELTRVLPPGGNVYVLGGPQAIDVAVSDRLIELGYDVQRRFGADRVATSIAIADELGNPQTLLIATGDDFADALSAGAAASHVGGAVVLTSSDQRREALDAHLAANPDATLFAVGGPAARPYPEATPVVGAAREETAVAVAEQFFDAVPAVGVAVRSNFPDSLAGGVHMARLGGPMLLSGSDSLHPATAVYLCGQPSITEAFLYGGRTVLDAQVRLDIADRIGGCDGSPPLPPG